MAKHEVPHVTIIRPIKGLDPHLYECLAVTFNQTYPPDRLSIRFCVSSLDDPAVPIVEGLLSDYPGYDARLLVEHEDSFLQSMDPTLMGPNPKIRNMSRAYREAKGDIIWILDCNVWVAKGVAGRMVDKLCGLATSGRGRKCKFVHQLPLVVDVTGDYEAFRSSSHSRSFQVASTSSTAFETVEPDDIANDRSRDWILHRAGGRLEEMFFASSHAKYYTSINTVLLAPCIVGKSNMFRKSHLDYLTSTEPGERPPGLDFFSHNICEDHLVGDLIWKRPVPEETGSNAEQWGKHRMLFGDLAIQPMARMSVGEYIARRARWLRVRKFTVTMATLVEPGTESFLCSLYGAYAFTKLPLFHQTLGIPQSWGVFAAFWIASICMWAFVDWQQYQILHSMASNDVDEKTPDFARPKNGEEKRSGKEWVMAWLGREALALPIWTWAVLGGVTVTWRGQRFSVGMDMRVHHIAQHNRPDRFERLNGSPLPKARRE